MIHVAQIHGAQDVILLTSTHFGKLLWGCWMPNSQLTHILRD